MGKKRVVKKTKEEVLKEKERMEVALKKEVKTKTQQKIQEGRVYVSSSYNNTFLTLTDSQGNTLTWTSAGNAGFKGTKKGTPFAASKVAEILAQRAQQLGVEKVKILVKGIGSGRESAIRSLINKGLNVISIEDVTPIPHNGCRPPKPRRV